MNAGEMDRLVSLVHEALGGNGWAYANYGNDELVSQRDGLEAVVRALRRDEQAEVVAWQPGERELAHRWAMRLCTTLSTKPDHADDCLWLERLSRLFASPSGGVTEARPEPMEATDISILDSYSRALGAWAKDDSTPDILRSELTRFLTWFSPIRDQLRALGVGDERMGEGWQPIETLPELTDMQSVMIAIPRKDNGEWIVGEATWRIEDDNGALWWAGTGPGDYYASPISEINDPPTHWRPLPTPPIQGDAK